MTRAFARMSAIELGNILPFIIVLGVIGVIDMRVYVAVHVPRVLLTVWYLRRLFEPIRRWRARGAAADDHELLAADDAIQQLVPRFLLPYATGWGLFPGLALLITVYALPDAEPLARSELLTAFVLLAIGVVINPVGHWAELRRLSFDLMVELGPQLVGRDLQPVRPKASLERELPRVVALMMFTCIAVLGVVGSQLRVTAVRAQTEAELREQVLRASVRARAGELVDGVEIVESGALPSVLMSSDEPRVAAADDMRSCFDAAHERVLAAASLGDGRWLVAAREPDEQLGWVVVLLLGILGVVLGLVTTILGSIMRVLLAPLELLTHATRRMAETGELVALARVAPMRADEVGSLVANFNAMLDMLEELVTAARMVAAGDLRVELERPGDLHDAFRAMLDQLHDMVERLRATALEVSAATSEIHASMREQEAAAHQHSARFGQLSDTTSSLARSAAQINDVAVGVLADAEQSLATVDAMAESIGELSRQAGGIGELLELIREVADRSDLLALNGSLEATRAGESGRGFALVASEMRRLAERVTGTVDDVRTRVAAIASASAATVTATQHSRALTQDTAEAARAISRLTSKQREDTEQVSGTASSLSEFVLAASTTTVQTSAAAQDLREQVEQLERLTREFHLRGELQDG